MDEATLIEKLTTAMNKADAAHKRLDKHENEVASSLKEISGELKGIHADLNKGKGWAAAGIFAISAFSAIVGAVSSMLVVK